MRALLVQARTSFILAPARQLRHLPRLFSAISPEAPTTRATGTGSWEETPAQSPLATDGTEPIAGDGAREWQEERRAFGDEASERSGPSTLQLGMIMTGIAILCKLMMMYDETQEPARIARRARRLAEAQERLRPLTREEWAALQSIGPQTPFDSPAARSGARVRAGGRHGLADYRDWGGDVLTGAMWRQEQALQRAAGGRGVSRSQPPP